MHWADDRLCSGLLLQLSTSHMPVGACNPPSIPRLMILLALWNLNAPDSPINRLQEELAFTVGQAIKWRKVSMWLGAALAAAAAGVLAVKARAAWAARG